MSFVVMLSTSAFSSAEPALALKLSTVLTREDGKELKARPMAPPPEQRLSNLIQKAWLGNPEIASALATESAEQARLDQARGRLLPQATLTADATFSHLSESAGTVDERYLTGRGIVSYALYNPRLRADVDLADEARQDSRLARLETASDLALRLLTAYLEVNNLREEMRALQFEKQLVANLQAINERRLDGGVGSITEVTESRFRGRLLDTQIEALHQDVEVQRAELRRLSGDPSADAAVLGEVSVLIPLDVATARRDMEERNPTLLRARQAITQAHIRLQTELHADRPNLDLVGQLDWGRDTSSGLGTASQTSSSMNLQLSMPLYTGGVLGAVEREMAALLSKTDLDWRATRDRLDSELLRAYAELKKYEGQVASNTQSLELAMTVSERTRKSFMAGFRGNIDVINAQKQISEVGRDLTKARAGLVATQARILALMGKLDDEAARAMDTWFSPPD
jgi:outer membrane protein